MTKEHHFPEKVNPFRFAENAAKLDGVLFIQNMLRLSESLFIPEGEAAVEIDFGIDEQGVRFLRGHVDTSLKLQCQRCMEPFIYGIISDFVYGIVAVDADADRLPKQYSPLVVENEKLVIQDLIEDELIVNLPIVPMHDPKQCSVKMPVRVNDLQDETDVTRDNPFKVIESLRKSKQDK